MPLQFTYSTTSCLDWPNASIDIIVNPIKETYGSYTAGSKHLTTEAGDDFSNKLMTSEARVNNSELTAAYGLRNKEIKFIVSTMIPSLTLMKKSDIEFQLFSYYTSSLYKAITKKPKSIAIPFIPVSNPQFSLDESIRLAIKEIQNVLTQHPHINCILIFEDIVSYENLQAIRNEVLPENKSKHSEAAVATSKPPTANALEEAKAAINSNKMTLFSHNNGLKLSIEPNTPAEAKGELRRVTTSFVPIIKNSRTKLQETWKNFSNSQLVITLEDSDSSLDYFKFLLGPSLYSLKCRFEHGAISKLSWDLYKLNINKSFLHRALEGILIYSEYLKHKKIFSLTQEQIKNSKLKLLKTEFNSAKNKYLNEYKDGLAKYQSYLSNKMSRGLSNEVNVEWKKIHTREDSVINNHDELIEKMEIWIVDWIASFITPKFATSHMRELNSVMIAENKRDLINCIRSIKKVNELISKLRGQCTDLRYKIASVESKVKSIAEDYVKLQLEEVRTYRKFAKKWLEIDVNYNLIKLMLSADESGYGGATPDELIDIIVKFAADETINTRSHQNIQLYYQLLNVRLKQKEAFGIELRKHTLDVCFEKVADIAKKMHQYVKHMQLYAETIQDKAQQNVSIALATNTQAALATMTEEPFEWHELSTLLQFIACKSEAQQALKLILLDYIKNRDPQFVSNKMATVGYDKYLLIERRRQLTYLISCLYLASAENLDEGILFNSFKKDKQQVGVNLILHHCQLNHDKSSDLVNQLTQYLQEKNLNHFCYYPENGSNPLLEAGDEPAIVIAKAIEPVYLTLFKYEATEAALKIEDELLEVDIVDKKIVKNSIHLKPMG